MHILSFDEHPHVIAHFVEVELGPEERLRLRFDDGVLHEALASPAMHTLVEVDLVERNAGLVSR